VQRANKFKAEKVGMILGMLHEGFLAHFDGNCTGVKKGWVGAKKAPPQGT